MKQRLFVVVSLMIAVSSAVLSGCNRSEIPEPLTQDDIAKEVERIQKDPKMNPKSKAAAIANLTGKPPVTGPQSGPPGEMMGRS